VAAVFEVPYNANATCGAYVGCDENDQTGCRDGIPETFITEFPNTPWGDPVFDTLFDPDGKPLPEYESSTYPWWGCYSANFGTAGCYWDKADIYSNPLPDQHPFIAAGNVGTDTIPKFFSSNLYRLIDTLYYLTAYGYRYVCGYGLFPWLTDIGLGSYYWARKQIAVNANQLSSAEGSKFLSLDFGNSTVPNLGGTPCNYEYTAYVRVRADFLQLGSSWPTWEDGYNDTDYTMFNLDTGVTKPTSQYTLLYWP
jgi:hypothetical protein